MNPPPALPPRPLPPWAWFLSFLLFPPGVFVAFGAARLLSWVAALALAALSYASIVGLVRLMTHLEAIGAGQLTRLLAATGGILMFDAWGFLLYRVGERVGYWSPAVRRSWRQAGWFAAVLLGLSLVGIILQLLLLNHPPL